MSKSQPQISDHEFKETMITHVRDTFNNDFSESISPQILRIKDEIRFCHEQAETFEPKLSDFRNSDEREPNEDEAKLLVDQAEFLYDAYIREQKLLALAEMKIIFLFKSLEISLKKLVEIAYSKKKAKELFRWEDIKDNFKDHNVYLSKFEEYDEVIELKQVSNNIKHSENINQKVNSIREFRFKSVFNYQDLEDFYSRIEINILSFISSLSNRLISNLTTGT